MLKKESREEMTPDSETHLLRFFIKWSLILLGLLFIVIILLLLYQSFKPDLQAFMHPNAYAEKFTHLIRGHGLGDAVLLISLIAVLDAIPGLSNSFVCVFAGVCYGPWLGWLINIVGDVIGNLMISYIISKIDISKKARKMGDVVARIQHFKYPFIGVVAGLLIPVIPSFLADYVAVKLKFPLPKFIAAIILGVMPATFLYAFGGDALLKGNHKRIIIASCCILVLFLLYGWFYKHKKGTEKSTPAKS